MLSRRQFLGASLGLTGVALVGPALVSAQTTPLGAAIDPTLFDYLSMSPSSIANLSQPMPLLAGNQQLQAETLGIALPFDMANDDQMHEWIVGMFNVALPSFIMQNAMRDDFVAITGFDVSQITSGAEIGEPPNMATFVRGTFDPAAVEAVWILNGYQPVEVAGHPVYSLFADAEIDLTNPISQMALARMNNATFLEDGTLAYTATLDLMEQVLTPQGTLLDQPGVLPALNTLDTPLIISAVLGPGNFLPALPLDAFVPTSQDDILAAMEALRDQASPPAQAPIVQAAIVGDSPGGPIEFKTRDAASIASQPISVTKFALAYASPEDALSAATQIEQRLASGSSVVTQEPWTSLFSEWSATPNPEQSSVLLSITWNQRASRAINLLFNRDLGFITG